jgi:hypothetical protein
MAYEEELKAIHKYCLHNCERANEGSKVLVEKCWEYDCSLYIYRMGIDPEQIGQTKERKESEK